MDEDRKGAEDGMWWMIEHPNQESAYWTGSGWSDYFTTSVVKFTTRGEAELELSSQPELTISKARITQHGPAILAKQEDAQ